jgi:predicted GIY-YIG superfamily endonuclease
MTERTAVYRLFAEDDSLLYVGISDNFGRRWKQHAHAQPWWPGVKRQTVEWFDTREDARAAETRAIHDECPTHNWQEVPASLRQPKPPRPPLPRPPVWTDYERAQAVGQIRDLLTRPDLSHAATRLMAASVLSTGRAELPRGAQLRLIARSCGVSVANAYKIIAELDGRRRAE